MMWMLLLGVLLACTSLSFARTWSGDLVDFQCFQREESNVNPDYISVPGAQDTSFEIRACQPRPNKTKAFGVVLPSGERVRLDPAGNAKAAALVRAAGKPKRYFVVEITGDLENHTIHVDSITAAK